VEGCAGCPGVQSRSGGGSSPGGVLSPSSHQQTGLVGIRSWTEIGIGEIRTTGHQALLVDPIEHPVDRTTRRHRASRHNRAVSRRRGGAHGSKPAVYGLPKPEGSRIVVSSCAACFQHWPHQSKGPRHEALDRRIHVNAAAGLCGHSGTRGQWHAGLSGRQPPGIRRDLRSREPDVRSAESMLCRHGLLAGRSVRLALPVPVSELTGVAPPARRTFGRRPRASARPRSVCAYEASDAHAPAAREPSALRARRVRFPRHAGWRVDDRSNRPALSLAGDHRHHRSRADLPTDRPGLRPGPALTARRPQWNAGVCRAAPSCRSRMRSNQAASGSSGASIGTGLTIRAHWNTEASE